MSTKYHNKPTDYNGIRFDSRKEEKRYQDLLLLERAGEIRDLELQPKYDLVVNGHKIGFYKGDFRYEVATTGQSVVEDCKGFRTPVYKLKKKLVKALHNVEIVEV